LFAVDDFRIAVLRGHFRSAIAYSCSTRAFFAAYRGSFDAFQVFRR
jgi:hypothetical protein